MKTTKTVNSCDCDSVNQELVDKVKRNFQMMNFLEIYLISLRL